MRSKPCLILTRETGYPSNDFLVQEALKVFQYWFAHIGRHTGLKKFPYFFNCPLKDCELHIAFNLNQIDNASALCACDRGYDLGKAVDEMIVGRRACARSPIGPLTRPALVTPARQPGRGRADSATVFPEWISRKP
jgi:hypothetical protein